MNGQYSSHNETSRIHTLSHYSLPVTHSVPSKRESFPQKYKHEPIDFNRYRDEIFEATEKKLLLITEQEISQHCKGDFLFWGRLKETKDVPLTRGKVGEVLKGKITDSSNLMNLLLAVSELTTNVIKHAEKGNITLFEAKDEFVCCIRDIGPGFNIKDLKGKTLVPGYSTKDSLGFGLSIVLKLADRLLLSNTKTGSVFLAKFSKQTSDKLFEEDSLQIVR